MEKILFIVNPVAGGGRSETLIDLIKDKMDKTTTEYRIILTKGPKDATRITKTYIDDYEIIVAVGGDGTVNEVARGLIEEKKGILGVIPGGTGNDLAKSLDLPMDPEESIKLLNEGNKKLIDVGKLNGSYFLNIASVGFDAEVVINTNAIKKRIKGKASYVLGVIYSFINLKTIKAEIQIDNELYEEEMILLAVGNGKYYGGGMKIIPMAKIDDDYFHICVVKKLNKFKLLLLFPSIFKGEHIKYKKYVKIYKGKYVKIKSKANSYINLDGEILPLNQEVEFEIADFKLKAICR